MKNVFVFLFLLGCFSAELTEASCTAILRGQEIHTDSDFKFERAFYPYQVKIEAGIKAVPMNAEDQILAQEKIDRGRRLFNEFFSKLRQQESATRASLDPGLMDTWVHLNLTRESTLDPVLELTSQIKRELNYTVQRFIYVLLADSSRGRDYVFRFAPMFIEEGVDNGFSKHVALADGGSVLAAGEIALEMDRSEIAASAGLPRLRFDLKSGTYMSGANAETQYRICRALDQYLKEWLGKDWQIEFNDRSVQETLG